MPVGTPQSFRSFPAVVPVVSALGWPERCTSARTVSGALGGEPVFDPSVYDKADLSNEEAEELEELEVLQVILGLKMEIGAATSEQLAAFADRVRRFKQAMSRRKTLPRALRAAVWEMTNGRCFYCGVWTNPYETFEIDHIRPKKRRGTDDIDNLVPSCTTCNQSKGEQLLEEWRVGKSAQGYVNGQGYVSGYGGSEGGPLWFETDDFRSARYEHRRAFIIQQWKQGRHDGFPGEFSNFPRYAPEVCRVQGVLYGYVWYEGRWVWESWAREQEESKRRMGSPKSDPA